MARRIAAVAATRPSARTTCQGAMRRAREQRQWKIGPETAPAAHAASQGSRMVRPGAFEIDDVAGDEGQAADERRRPDQGVVVGPPIGNMKLGASKAISYRYRSFAHRRITLDRLDPLIENKGLFRGPAAPPQDAHPQFHQEMTETKQRSSVQSRSRRSRGVSLHPIGPPKSGQDVGVERNHRRFEIDELGSG